MGMCVLSECVFCLYSSSLCELCVSCVSLCVFGYVFACLCGCGCLCEPARCGGECACLGVYVCVSVCYTTQFTLNRINNYLYYWNYGTRYGETEVNYFLHSSHKMEMSLWEGLL